MGKGGLYPFRIRVSDPELANVLKLMSRCRAVQIPNSSVARKAGIKLRPIRRDVFIGTDNRYYKSFISLPPELDLEYVPKGKAYDFIFKSIF